MNPEAMTTTGLIWLAETFSVAFWYGASVA
jgi:hypothetical protein